MKKILIVLVFLIGCSNPINFIAEKEVLPEGYKILCSVDRKAYTIEFPVDSKMRGSRSVNVWYSEQDAIGYAIYWEKNKDIPSVIASNKYEWENCAQTK